MQLDDPIGQSGFPRSHDEMGGFFGGPDCLDMLILHHI